MSKLNHILILDPIAFAGGSKVSTKHVLSQLKSKEARVTILTADPKSWKQSQAYVQPLCMPEKLEKAEQGLSYFARHLFIALQLLWLRLFVGKIDTALAASGPGVDLALYLIKPLFGFKLIQMIHGPVARSRTIGRCLKTADNVFYLSSAQHSLEHALEAAGYSSDICSYTNFQTFKNGLPKNSWPSPCQYDYSVVFWAASLLKWKGLDVLLRAIRGMRPSMRPETHICYIKPQQNNLPVSEAPQPINKVFWHHAPENLDHIRASANVFISTSTKEPFGLSILEAMAAGMCIIIPSDGAFWDQQLTDGVNCIKYTPDDENALTKAIVKAQSDMTMVKSMGKSVASIAQSYRAEICFSAICSALMSEQTSVLDNISGERA
ncbi:glycosyltransferase family 4 protein [Enterovibrio sp. ZSDZ35]|uniref:Glycosyltransferase family 4 protein n=1 Tax=Enterovibrio qingdaonensis TaxID=2899818 RepID=A0ABT5QUI7_9GAMM|nr:glycosyltransferase family 4 protein [Enterovibrio sp. ZSDZ35]MDD1783946.1 glycosyltransferase family 4 protein [Enterovibrio sp. ZSDZ35]